MLADLNQSLACNSLMFGVVPPPKCLKYYSSGLKLAVMGLHSMDKHHRLLQLKFKA